MGIQFTGAILIADDFIEELYVHMGFHPAWKFRKVVELIFETGKVMDIRDISKQIEQIRSELVKQPLQPSLADGQEKIKAWIKSTFSLDYDL